MLISLASNLSIHRQALVHIACLWADLSNDDSLTSTQQQAYSSYFQNISDWQGLIDKAEKYGLAPLMYYQLQRIGIELDEEQRRRLKTLVFRHKKAAQIRHQALSEIVPKLQQDNIDFIALKGVLLAAMLYPDVSYRPMGDMDLLIDKAHISKIYRIMHELGYDMGEYHSKYMKAHHHLPSADKKIQGMNVSIEWHIDAIGRDFVEHLETTQSSQEQTHLSVSSIDWQGIELKHFELYTLLNQLCHNISGVEYYIKLINIVDIYALLIQNLNVLNKQKLQQEYSFVYNIVRCLHLYVPLPDKLHKMFDIDNINVTKLQHRLTGIGESMQPVSQIFEKKAWKLKLKALLLPPSWWMHMFYNVDLNRSLFWVRVFKHPCYLSYWLMQRIIFKNDA